MAKTAFEGANRPIAQIALEASIYDLSKALAVNAAEQNGHQQSVADVAGILHQLYSGADRHVFHEHLDTKDAAHLVAHTLEMMHNADHAEDAIAVIKALCYAAKGELKTTLQNSWSALIARFPEDKQEQLAREVVEGQGHAAIPAEGNQPAVPAKDSSPYYSVVGKLAHEVIRKCTHKMSLDEFLKLHKPVPVAVYEDPSYTNAANVAPLSSARPRQG